MPTPQRSPGLAVTSARTVAPHKPPPNSKDAIAMLRAAHEALGHLFAEYGNTYSLGNKKALVAELCTALSVRAQIAEEIFYPAVNGALKDERIAPGYTVGNAAVKDLIAQLEGAEPDGAPYDAKVKALSERVKQHVRAEQREIFPKARASALDLVELGARMAARRHGLLAHRW